MSSQGYRTMLIGLSLAASLGCSGAQIGPLNPPDAGTDAPQVDAMAQDVFERINRRRQSVGRPPLVWHPMLSALAAEHSAEMASGRRSFGHDGFEARIAAARSAMQVSGGSENVGRNTYPPSQVVSVAVSGWIDSPGHRENLEGSYMTTGVGVARAPGGEYFLTQLFIAN